MSDAWHHSRQRCGKRVADTFNMKFLHTADWQIGMKAAHLGDRAKEVRKARLLTIERIVELANREKVDFVLVAGDQFEDAAPEREEVVAVASRLKALQMPAFVLPGNHDPGGAASLYTWTAWTQPLQGSGVQTILDPTTVDLPGGGVLLAAPCTTRYSSADPTLWFADKETGAGSVRIGMAHGTLQRGDIAAAVDAEQQAGYPIAVNAASRANLAYLALGHFHCAYQQKDGLGLIAYSGTPEQTAFDDHDCGSVSIVTIADGQTQAQQVPVGTYHWQQLQIPLSQGIGVQGVAALLERYDDPKRTLLRLRMHGLCTPDQLDRLKIFTMEKREEFYYFDAEIDYTIQPETREAWLEMVPPGAISEVASELWDLAAGDQGQRKLAIAALQELVEASR